MPTKKVTYNKDKAVIVRVYAEKPRNRKKKSSSLVEQHHHHHHLHYHIHQTFHGHEINNGYDRRAGLLRYSQLLRDSAKGASSSSSSSSSTTLLSKFANRNLQPVPTQMATSKKAKDGVRPGCFGNLKLLVPSCLTSWSNFPKKKKKKKQMSGVFSGNGIKFLQVRGRSFISNVFSFSTSRKRN